MTEYPYRLMTGRRGKTHIVKLDDSKNYRRICTNAMHYTDNVHILDKRQCSKCAALMSFAEVQALTQADEERIASERAERARLLRIDREAACRAAQERNTRYAAALRVINTNLAVVADEYVPSNNGGFFTFEGYTYEVTVK